MPIQSQYAGDQSGFSFLDGSRHMERTFGMKAHYQPLRDVFLDGTVQLHTLTDDAYPAQNFTHQFEFTLGARVGLW
jgi:hypothetical protein